MGRVDKHSINFVFVISLIAVMIAATLAYFKIPTSDEGTASLIQALEDSVK